MSYYNNIGGKNNAPVTIEELRVWAIKGVIQADTSVIDSQKKEWKRRGDMVESLSGKPLLKPVSPVVAPRAVTPQTTAQSQAALGSESPITGIID